MFNLFREVQLHDPGDGMTTILQLKKKLKIASETLINLMMAEESSYTAVLQYDGKHSYQV